MRFRTGDQVRVNGLSNSGWHGMRGTVVAVLPDGDKYAVQFRHHRRWFLATDLSNTLHDPFARFLRGELLNRYKELLPDEIGVLPCHRPQVIAFLRDRYGFTNTRTQREVDDLFIELCRRLNCATGNAYPPEQRDAA